VGGHGDVSSQRVRTQCGPVLSFKYLNKYF
jgi:hypothetical protein